MCAYPLWCLASRTCIDLLAKLPIAGFLVILATTSWACPAPVGPADAANAWEVVELDPDNNHSVDGMVGETYYWQVARSAAYPGLTVPLPMYGIAGGEILDWVTLARYNHKIGLLQYSAGSAGTSVAVEFVNSVVVDLANQKALGAANVLVTNYGDVCNTSKWTWSDTGLRVLDEGISDLIEFTFDFGAGPKRYLDD